jgi:outer membrane protein assembly factor BamB
MRRPGVCLLLALALVSCRGRQESAARGGSKEVRVLWAAKLDGVVPPMLGPAVAEDGTVYAQGRMQATTTWDGRPAMQGMQQAVLHALDSAGTVVRSLPGTTVRGLGGFKLWIRVAPWGAAYAVDSEGGLYGMFTDGTQHYRQVKEGLFGPPAIADNGRLFVGASRGTVGYDLQGEDDPAQVLYQASSYTLAPVFAPDGATYVPALRGLQALDAYGGVKWSVPAGLAMPVVGPQGTVYCSAKNRLLAVDVNGSQLWEYHADDDLTPPVMAPDGSVVVIGTQGLLHVVAPDGQRRWAFALETMVHSLPVVGGDGTIYVSDREGRVMAIGAAGKRRWAIRMKRECGTPAVTAAGTVYVQCADGTLYALAPPA